MTWTKLHTLLRRVDNGESITMEEYEFLDACKYVFYIGPEFGCVLTQRGRRVLNASPLEETSLKHWKEEDWSAALGAQIDFSRRH